MVEGHGAAGVPGLSPGLRSDGGQRRSVRVGAFRIREAAGVSLGHLPCRSGPRSAHWLWRFRRAAGLAGGAGRIPQPAAPADRDAGRHRAGQRRAAAMAGTAMPEPVRSSQPLPGERRGRTPPLGDGLPAALVLRPRRPRRSGGAARAAERQSRQAAHPRRVQRADRQLARLLHVHDVHRSRRQVAAAVAVGKLARSAVADDALHADRRSASHVRRRDRRCADRRAHLPAAEGGRLLRRRAQARRHRPADDPEIHQPLVQPQPGSARQRDLDQCRVVFRQRPEGARAGREVGRSPRHRSVLRARRAGRRRRSSARPSRCARR